MFMNSAFALKDPIAGLLGSWAADITVGSILLRILLSLFLGAVIGWERSNKRHSAGLRTFMLAFLVRSPQSLTVMYLLPLPETASSCCPRERSSALPSLQCIRFSIPQRIRSKA